MRRDLWESPLPTDKKRSVLNEREKDLVRTGTRTQNLLLRRQAPYPLGHTDIDNTLNTLVHTYIHKSADTTNQKRKKVEKQGIDPCASCMLSKRSTI